VNSGVFGAVCGDFPAACVFANLPGPLQRVLSILGRDAAPGVVLDGSTCCPVRLRVQPIS
jgi:hypothetical protein